MLSLKEYSRLVSVQDDDSVRLSEGFLGNCTPYLPQYLMMAILLGERQVILPGSGASEESRIR
jgi:hypothetical protein